jgi:hypothetical protein
MTSRRCVGTVDATNVRMLISEGGMELLLMPIAARQFAEEHES